MCLSVRAYKSCPVHRKHDRQLLKTYIFHDLVISPLQESRVYSKYRFKTAGRKTGRKGHRMLFCNTHVKKSPGVHDVEGMKTHTVLHGSCDRHHRRIRLSNLEDLCREHISISLCFLGLRGQACFDDKRRRPVEAGRLSLRRQVSLSFFCADVNQNRFIDTLGVFNGFHDALYVVPVDGSQIRDPHLFEVHSRDHQRFERLLRAADPLYYAGNRVTE